MNKSNKNLNNSVIRPINVLTISILIGFALFLLWIGNERYEDYLLANKAEADNASNIASAEVERIIDERVRLVEIFAHDHLIQLLLLADNPQDETLFNTLNEKLKRYFIDYFTMNIATNHGDAIIDDFDGKLGEICITDMKAFTETGQRVVRVHPNQNLYHYDVVIKLLTDDRELLLFISFGLDELTRLLWMIQPDNQELMLIQNSRDHLIELTDTGSRNTITDRLDFRFTEAEKARILSSSPVNGTLWTAASLVTPGVLEAYRSSLLKEGLGIYLVFLIITLVMRHYLNREERKRTHAEENLFERNREIEQLNIGLLRANEQLKLTASTDSLTGLHNRRYFDEQITQEFNRAIRTGQPISLLMFDIDYFKQYNDFYGHQQGDTCLQIIAELMTQYFKRADDFVARYGGEEFVVIMTGADEQHAMEIARQFKAAIAHKKLEHQKSKIGNYVTISAGLVSTILKKGDTPSHLLKRADELLYEAKAMGRNRIRSE